MIVNLVLKLVLSPIIVILCDLFSPYQINYGSVYEALVVGLFVAVVNFAIEWLMLTRGTLWVTTILDFVVTMSIVFFGTMAYNDAIISTVGALMISLLITIMEYLLHAWLLRQNWKTRLVAK